MSNLTDLVNRLRSQGYKYEIVKEKLVKMGNGSNEVDNAISEYIKEMCGV